MRSNGRLLHPPVPVPQREVVQQAREGLAAAAARADRERGSSCQRVRAGQAEGVAQSTVEVARTHPGVCARKNAVTERRYIKPELVALLKTPVAMVHWLKGNGAALEVSPKSAHSDRYFDPTPASSQAAYMMGLQVPCEPAQRAHVLAPREREHHEAPTFPLPSL